MFLFVMFVFYHALSVITRCFSMPTFKTSFPPAPGSVRTAAGISYLRGGPQPTSKGIDANLDGFFDVDLGKTM